MHGHTHTPNLVKQTHTQTKGSMPELQGSIAMAYPTTDNKIVKTKTKNLENKREVWIGYEKRGKMNIDVTARKQYDGTINIWGANLKIETNTWCRRFSIFWNDKPCFHWWLELHSQLSLHSQNGIVHESWNKLSGDKWVYTDVRLHCAFEKNKMILNQIYKDWYYKKNKI